MERESFEDEEVANVLNKHYVAIKVDREERPDIDEQLMLATQLMTGRGGWPNSVFLTTDGRPWLAGTYFPKAQFISMLEQLAVVWDEQADAVEKQAEALSDAIRKTAGFGSQGLASEVQQDPLKRTMLELEQIFDSVNGGFGSRPKFPPHGVLRLLALEAANGSEKAVQMMESTLGAMWCGGIHDHVGGGFHRYSTDERWFLPHFEKMLYDNAQLMRAYTEAFAIVPEAHYRAAVEDIFGWLQREMTHEEGAFFSAIDSESEGGEEGRYYTWNSEELQAVLTKEESEEFSRAYHFEDEGNFEEEATGKKAGSNIPYLTVAQLSLSMDSRLAAIRKKLNHARSDREYPHLDDKLITSWNGLMISALARAGAVFQDQKYIDAAEKAADFVGRNLFEDGKLLRTWRDGKASLPGYLNDYAFLCEAYVELYKATDDERWLERGTELATQMLDLFEDKSAGGFFFTNEYHEELLLRTKNLSGGGNLPVGNGIAVLVLMDLAESMQDRQNLAARFSKAAEKSLLAFSDLIGTQPRTVEQLVLANVKYVRKKQGDVQSKQRFANHILAAELKAPSAKVRRGQEFEISLEVTIAPGYRLYADSDANLANPTEVQWTGSEGLEVSALPPPASEEKVDPVLKQELAIYTDKIVFTAAGSLANDSGQEAMVIAKLSFQACDSKRCYAPMSIELQLELPVE